MTICVYFLLLSHIYIFDLYRSGSTSEPTRSKKTRKGDGRGKSTRPEARYVVTAIDPANGGPLKPDAARKKFKTVCGIVARERVSINLPSWKKVSKEDRAAMKREILKYFIIRTDDDRKRVERAALLTANKAWKAWKSKLVTEYVYQDLTPFSVWPQIKEEVWAEFVKVKSSAEFKAKSKAARELALTNSNPHKMGTAGYAGMSEIWEKQDAEAVAAGLPKPFSNIKDERTRRWTRARTKSDETTGYVPALVSSKDIEVYEKLVRLHDALFFIYLFHNRIFPSVVN